MIKSWKTDNTGAFFDELITPAGRPRVAARGLVNLLQSLSREEMSSRRAAAELAIRDMGISFTIYSEGKNIDRAWPFDIIPRVIPARDWDKVSRGLIQRSRALNCFIDDIYNKQKILADGIVPAEIVLDSGNYKPQCAGMSPRFGAWAHICGTDLVRDKDGKFYVLEDNLRVPSGVSYMLENRQITKRVLPELFENYSIRRGVVDESGKCHDLENLYLADTGIFPQCPSVNPMWTGMALARRTALAIADRL